MLYMMVDRILLILRFALSGPIPRAHIALYNGRTAEVLKDLNNFDKALNETIQMIDSQILSMI